MEMNEGPPGLGASAPKSGDIRVLALDLDGTLLSKEYAISDRSLGAIAAFRATGRMVVIATGRSRRSALPFAQRIGGVSALVCHNGSAVYDCASSSEGTLISESRLPAELARRMIALSRRLGLHFHAFREDDYFYETGRPGTALYERRSGFQGHMVNFDDFEEPGFNKMMFVSKPGEELDAAAAAAREACAGEAAVLFSDAECLEILPLGVTKATGLEAWLPLKSLTLASVMAIGDADNDREMILAAGLGVAMGTAPRDLRDRAALVTGSVAEEGVALAVEGFLSGKG